MSKAAELFDTSHPLINFLGFTEWTVYDYGVGFASGFFKKDMQNEWAQCIQGAPDIGKRIYNVGQKVVNQNWLDITNVLMNLSLWQEIFNLGMDVFRQGPADFKACSAIFDEFNQVFAFIVKHLDIAQTGINIVTNLGSHFMEIAGDVMSLMTDSVGGHPYEVGKDTGNLFVTLVE